MPPSSHGATGPDSTVHAFPQRCCATLLAIWLVAMAASLAPSTVLASNPGTTQRAAVPKETTGRRTPAQRRWTKPLSVLALTTALAGLAIGYSQRMDLGQTAQWDVGSRCEATHREGSARANPPGTLDSAERGLAGAEQALARFTRASGSPPARTLAIDGLLPARDGMCSVARLRDQVRGKPELERRYLELVNGYARLALSIETMIERAADEQGQAPHWQGEPLGRIVRRQLAQVAAGAFGVPEGTVAITTLGNEHEVWWSNDPKAGTLLGRLPARKLESFSSDDAAQIIPPPPPLGEHPADGVLVGNSPVLKYLPQGLHALTAGDLVKGNFRTGEAPDPRRLFEEMRLANQNPPADVAKTLQVVSLNAANYRLLADSPRYSRRPSRLPTIDGNPMKEPRLDALLAQLFGRGHDIVLGQEFGWEPHDLRKITGAAEEAGYQAFVGPRDIYNDGLVTFVARDLLGKATGVRFRTRAYDRQWVEGGCANAGCNLGLVYRGSQLFSATLPGVGEVTFLNAHQTPRVYEWFMPPADAEIRFEQARELGLIVSNLQPLIGGGDLNASFGYPHDTVFDDKGDIASTGWLRNSFTPWLFLHYADAPLKQTWAATASPAQLNELHDYLVQPYVAPTGKNLHDKLDRLASRCQARHPAVTVDPHTNPIQLESYPHQPPSMPDQLFASGDIFVQPTQQHRLTTWTEGRCTPLSDHDPVTARVHLRLQEARQ